MATNVFFSQAVESEQNLVEDLVVESLRMYGHDCYYLPRTIVNEDTILGEVANSTFDDAYEAENEREEWLKDIRTEKLRLDKLRHNK